MYQQLFLLNLLPLYLIHLETRRPEQNPLIPNHFLAQENKLLNLVFQKLELSYFEVGVDTEQHFFYLFLVERERLIEGQ